MWIFIGKKVARVSTQIVRQVSNFADDLGESLIEAKKGFFNDRDNRKNIKSLKIAILGLPNVGKSTLINHLIGRPVCAVSQKVHTTRSKAAAICSIDDTQLVFLDTPGLVGKGDIKKYKLEESFTRDAENSMKEADVVGVVQDMTNIRSRELISEKILSLLKSKRDDTNSILILNKIDTLTNKKDLLGVVAKLTSKEIWPNFTDVFMISALTGDGIDDLRNYFLDSAKDKNWEYKKDTITDQPVNDMIQRVVRSKLLDSLNQELPYRVNVGVEHLDYYPDNTVDVLVRIQCPTSRISRLLVGVRGERIKMLAKNAEQDLCKIFQTTVRLRLEVPGNEVKEKLRLNKSK
ncbi:GTPase Era, mitochondrial [Copidosoma floridanum]|uniref:GTPase Era, mitochondrial n=1 Tax=Copidosoma floridanum TaxID=29053 RepID=UPI0006C9DEEB|nr:GTPase Era, mitochondrial [Copidosoma floridanum]